MGDLPRQLDPPHRVIPITPCTIAWGFLKADVSLSLPSQTGPCLDLFLPCDFWSRWEEDGGAGDGHVCNAGKVLGQQGSSVLSSEPGGGGGRMEVELLWASTLKEQWHC